MATYFGEATGASRQRTTYVLTNQISHGAEGTVYDIQGRPGFVAKIYNQARYDAVTNRREGRPDGRRFMHQKLCEMVRIGTVVNTQQWSSIRGHCFLAWPVDTIVDASGLFCGYVMPRVKGTGNLYGAVDTYAHDGFFGRGKYTWKTSIKIAKQLAYVVGKLHEGGIVLGDFNPQNFLLDRDGLVSFVDIDSYTISPVYKTLVAFPGLVAPELQGMPWSKTAESCQFTERSDNFSLACLVFQLLTGVHPFNAVVMKPGMGSVSQSNQETNIRNGDCPYVKHGIAKRKADAPDVFGLLFPDYLRSLCIRCFNYTSADATDPKTIMRRPSAAEWYVALDRLDKEKLTLCNKGQEPHYYLPGAGTLRRNDCPWCERDDYINSLQQQTSRGGSSAGASSGSVGGTANTRTTTNATTGATTQQTSGSQSSGGSSGSSGCVSFVVKLALVLFLVWILWPYIKDIWPLLLVLVIIFYPTGKK